MTFTDIVILIVTITIVSFIVYHMIRHKDEGSCDRCSYAKKK